MRLLSSFVAAALAGAAARQLPSQTISCQPRDGHASQMRQSIVQIVTASDSASAAARTEFHLPAASDSAVEFVADDSLCTEAARAFIQQVGGPADMPHPVYLLRVGSDRYVVFDGVHRVNGEELKAVFDSTFKYLLYIVG